MLCDRIAPVTRNEEGATWIRVGTEKRSLALSRSKIPRASSTNNARFTKLPEMLAGK